MRKQEITLTAAAKILGFPKDRIISTRNRMPNFPKSTSRINREACFFQDEIESYKANFDILKEIKEAEKIARENWRQGSALKEKEKKRPVIKQIYRERVAMRFFDNNLDTIL